MLGDCEDSENGSRDLRKSVTISSNNHQTCGEKNLTNTCNIIRITVIYHFLHMYFLFPHFALYHCILLLFFLFLSKPWLLKPQLCSTNLQGMKSPNRVLRANFYVRRDTAHPCITSYNFKPLQNVPVSCDALP